MAAKCQDPHGGSSGPSPTPVPEVHHVSNHRPAPRPQSHPLCYCCGKENHLPTTCSFRETKCYNCGKVGHLRAVCKSLRRTLPHCLINRTGMYATLRKCKQKMTNTQCTMSRRKPLLVDLTVEGQQLTMEIH